MIHASDLIGCELRTETGERLGRVHDLRAEQADGGWALVGLVIGRGGFLARMSGSDHEPLVRGDFIAWQAVVGLGDGVVTVRDGTSGESGP